MAVSGAARTMRGEGPGGPAARAIKVLHVLDNLGMGGAETWLMELMRFWHGQSRPADTPRFDFLATGGVPTYYDQEAKQLGANIFYVRFERAQLASFARRFRQVLRRGGYSAIHDHGDYVAGWHFLMGRGLLPQVRVVHVHNPAFFIRDNYGVTTARRLTTELGKTLVARYATHIIATSRQAIGEYGFDARRFQHVPKMALHCAFDTRPFGQSEAARSEVRREFGWPADAKIVLFAGRLDQSLEFDHPLNHKNSAVAVAIGIEAARLDPTVHMIFAGALSLAAPILQERIAKAGLGERIHFLGIRNDLKRLMYASDVLLFPSRGEGLGMVVVEAQAAGLPVLASDAVPRECVVVPELVRFEPLARSTKEWAVALLEQAARPRDIAAANRRVAASPFAIENSARALIELYAQGLPG